MKYHKEEMIKCGAWLMISLLLAAGVLAGFIYVVVNGVRGGVAVVLLLIFAYMGFAAWANASGLAKTIEQYNAVKASGLLKVLEKINPYPTNTEMLSAFKEEKKHKLYEDSQIVVTDTFLGSGNFSLLLDGILDARVIVHKTNGVTEKVELIILYYDGEKTTFDYYRPAGFSGSSVMQEQANNLEIVLNLIARKSRLFRKYDCCRL